MHPLEPTWAEPAQAGTEVEEDTDGNHPSICSQGPASGGHLATLSFDSQFGLILLRFGA